MLQTIFDAIIIDLCASSITYITYYVSQSINQMQYQTMSNRHWKRCLLTLSALFVHFSGEAGDDASM